MTAVDLRSVGKEYAGRPVIEGLDLHIESGSFTVLVGPSGCGKSTTLRMIAGLEAPTSGRVVIGGVDMTDVPPGRRGVAMVFQNYAIYPTMTVSQNIEFGLRNSGVSRTESRHLAEEIAATVGLTAHLGKRPDALSGGERQRVALARAMVKKPDVFLMDEPLSNLDAKLRQHMRSELTELHARLGATFVYVTHDQVEAMSMGSRIVLMDGGRIMQESTPKELYHQPLTVFSGRFIGSPAMNIVPVGALGAHGELAAPEGAAFAGIRPEKLSVVQAGTGVPPEVLALSATAVSSENLGAEIIDRVQLAGGERIAVRRFDVAESLAGDVLVAVHEGDIAWFDSAERRIARRAVPVEAVQG
jgi:sn-glycerol 3-phosphate transport system ATP-binding protein